ncbi:restriction endonuclease subunit S [Gulosibacter sediminis]|uniref:restriction endonuclease subunit S n=1 Tax=Gulosibacter sediminis TaxID=1729695 RepID=UPI0018677249|nr:restriction endonuclease subunit S [Gulosibacter sediminis]
MFETTLGDACERVDYGLTTSATAHSVGPRFLRITDIEHSHVDWNAVPYCVATSQEIQKYSLTDGDIVVARTGASTGRSQWVRSTEPAVFASYLVRFRVRPEFDSRFVSYILQSADWLRFVDSQAHGKSAQPNMSASAMAAFSFMHPPLAEQQAIAEVLGALDDKIAANLALAGLIDEYLAGLLEKITHGTGTTSLRAIADVNRQSVRPEVGRQLRYVDIASVGVGTFEYPGVSDWADAPGRARRGLAAGDTVWSTVRPNRRSHALNLEDDPMLVASTGLAVLSPRTVGFAYLYESTRRPEFTSFLENVAEGSAYPAVRADRFLEAPVPDLPATSIRRFEDTAAPLRELVAVQARENRTLGATRDALLPQLMSGKLRVRDAEAMAFTAGATTPTGANDEC